jgi:hypothetical protein
LVHENSRKLFQKAKDDKKDAALYSNSRGAELVILDCLFFVKPV